MARLSIHLLGPFHVTLDGEPATGFESNKVRALLAFLAVESDRPHSREALAGLFWPDQPEPVARHNLRQVLSNLRQVMRDCDAASPFLNVTRNTVQFNASSDHWLDVNAFTTHVEACQTHPHPRLETCEPCMRQLEQAVEIYRGGFLAGFFVDDSTLFEEWAVLLRERSHRLALDALYHLARYHERRRDYERARRYARRQVELEPWREEAHQQLMRLLARSGQRSAALRQYETCRRILAAELGVAPHQETTALYQRIRAAGSARPHNLPEQPTPFVGRETELAEIADRLENPACRLLTLVGPGGIGKTRLALQAATEALDAFLHGAYLAPLAPVSSVEFLVPTVANALGFQFHGPREPAAQLVDYLREKELLLVMDSFEHLLHGTGWLADLLASAPHVKILATSRERLNLRAEWLLCVAGLSYPPNGRTTEQGCSAVQLFVQNASRVRADFSLSEENRPFVARICQLVEGMPLGIELAAAWVQMFSCEQIAQEIQRDLDFLTTPLRDVPERHRSIRAVFDHSWNRLSEMERDVFGKLSVFRGGFGPEAATKVAGASRPVLAALLDKSLLHQLPSERYDMHELLRQCAAEKLDQVPAMAEKTPGLHSAYYADFLQQREKRLKSTEQKDALEEIGAEIDNVRMGWRWAVERREDEIVQKYLDSLYYFYIVRGWFQEGEGAFERAATRFGADSPSDEDALTGRPGAVLGRAMARQGRFAFHLGHYEKARKLCQTGLAISRRLGDWENVAFALLNLGCVSHVLGEYVEARQLCQDSLSSYRDLGDQPGVAFCLNNLGNVARAQGEYDAARRLYQDCFAIRRKIGDAQGTAIALNNLSNVAEALGEYAEAQRLYRECLAICQEIGYQPGMAASLTNLGYVAWKLGECAEAKRLHQESLAIKRELGDRRSIALSLINIGEVTCTRGEFQASRAYLAEALKLAAELQLVPVILEALMGMAALLAKTGQEGQALELCAFISSHPSTRKEVHDRATTLLASHLPAQVVAAAQAGETAGTLEAMVEKVLKSFPLTESV